MEINVMVIVIVGICDGNYCGCDGASRLMMVRCWYWVGLACIKWIVRTFLRDFFFKSIFYHLEREYKFRELNFEVIIKLFIFNTNI